MSVGAANHSPGATVSAGAGCDPAVSPATAVLAGLVTYGPFFAVQVHLPGSVPPAPWQPLARLFAADVFAARVSAVQAALAVMAPSPSAQVPQRVAVSVTHLGVAARLIAPVFAGWVQGWSTSMNPSQVYWQSTMTGPLPLTLPVDAAAERDSSALAIGSSSRSPLEALMNGPLSALTAVAASMAVSPTVLWGNVASAINSSATIVSGRTPELARAARQLADQALDHGQLRGRHSRGAGPGFRRRSCCLIYRLQDSDRQYCGDCILG